MHSSGDFIIILLILILEVIEFLKKKLNKFQFFLIKKKNYLKIFKTFYNLIFKKKLKKKKKKSKKKITIISTLLFNKLKTRRNEYELKL